MFDTELFINEIQTRPPLWNTKLKDYSNRDIKGKLWVEVSCAIVQNWDELNNADKNKEVKELRKKWKSIRDAFTREVRLQKQPSGSGKLTRKRYIYFDQLLFLLDTLQERSTLTNFNNRDSREANSADETNNEDHQSADTMSDTGDVASPTSASQNLPPTRRIVKQKANNFEQEILQHIKSQKRNEEFEADDDKLFLLSLLPMFMKLDDRMKIWVRMKFMETMQQAITFGMPSPSISNTINIPAHPSFNNNTPAHHPSSNNPTHLQLGNNIPTYPPFYNDIPNCNPSSNKILGHLPTFSNISVSYPRQNNIGITQPSPSPCSSRPSSAVEAPTESPTYTDLSSSHSQDSSIFDIYE